MNSNFGSFSERKFRGKNLLDKISALEGRVKAITRAELSLDASALEGDIFNNPIVIQDADGTPRLILSPTNLYEQLGVSAHLVALKEDGTTVTWYVDADTGNTTTDGDYMDILDWMTSLTAAKAGAMTINVLLYDPANECIYVGGLFTSIGGVTANRIAKYDIATKTFSALAGITDGYVLALALDSAGNLYAGGSFTNAGGDGNADSFAVWNGSVWAACGTAFGGVAGSVYALAVDASDNVYIGGTFQNVGDADGDRIVMWDGAAYSSMGSGLNSSVYTLTMASSGVLYVGGLFTDAGSDANADTFCKWTSGAFSAVGTAFAGSTAAVHDIHEDASGNIYVGGAFTDIGDANGDYVVKWNGSAYSSLGTSPLNGAVYEMDMDSEGNLWLGGLMTTGYIRKWDGSSFSTPASGVDNYVYALAVDGDDNVYLGGNFREGLDGRTLWGLARYGAASLTEILEHVLERSNKAVILGGSPGVAVGGGLTRYTAPYRDDIAGTSTLTNLIMPRAGVMKNLYIRAGAQPGDGALVINVYSDATLILTTTIAAGAAAGNFTDLTNSAYVAAGTRISVEFVNASASDSAVIRSWSLEYY